MCVSLSLLTHTRAPARSAAGDEQRRDVGRDGHGGRVPHDAVPPHEGQHADEQLLLGVCRHRGRTDLRVPGPFARSGTLAPLTITIVVVARVPVGGINLLSSCFLYLCPPLDHECCRVVFLSGIDAAHDFMTLRVSSVGREHSVTRFAI